MSDYNGNQHECLQLEISHDNGGNWTDFESCKNEDGTYSVDVDDSQSLAFQSRMCLIVDGDIIVCGESSVAGNHPYHTIPYQTKPDQTRPDQII